MASSAPRGARRGWILAGIGVVAAFASFGLLGEALGSEPRSPESSSYATNARGLAAWAELLDRAGHRTIQLRTPLKEARLDAASTVVILDPDALLPSEGARLLAFVRDGGRLLIGGRDPQSTLPALLAHLPEWTAESATHAAPGSYSGATVAGVREVLGAGEGEWRSTAGYGVPLRSAAGGALLLERALGRGELELLADASPLQNRLLASADNAQLAVNIAGAPARPVVLVESVHGFGQSRGLGALPARWLLALAGLALAGMLWTYARARRLGPPESQDASTIPPRFAYVEALSLLLRRADRAQELSAALARLRDRQ